MNNNGASTFSNPTTSNNIQQHPTTSNTFSNPTPVCVGFVRGPLPPPLTWFSGESGLPPTVIFLSRHFQFQHSSKKRLEAPELPELGHVGTDASVESHTPPWPCAT
eukprot:Hpha_TRINITY_DN16140_c0_g6::TRINITY_DN16140_c0_g6_i1::g.8611::m.8611